MKGVILQTYGAGNIPDKPYLFDELKAACDRGVIVVNCTQCSSGVVTDMYSGGIVSFYSSANRVVVVMTRYCRNCAK